MSVTALLCAYGGGGGEEETPDLCEAASLAYISATKQETLSQSLRRSPTSKLVL